MKCGRPELCEHEEDPHALNWLTDDFAYCPGCDLLYTKQPGVMVWIYDPYACRLADAVMAAKTRELAASLGLTDTNDIFPTDPREES